MSGATDNNDGFLPPPAGDWTATLVPVNVIAAASANAIVPLVAFTVLFAFALLLGRYSGYRLNELLRFRALAREPDPIVPPPAADDATGTADRSGSAVRCFMMISWLLSPSNGTRPVSSSYRITPSE